MASTLSHTLAQKSGMYPANIKSITSIDIFEEEVKKWCLRNDNSVKMIMKFAIWSFWANVGKLELLSYIDYSELANLRSCLGATAKPKLLI